MYFAILPGIAFRSEQVIFFIFFYLFLSHSASRLLITFLSLLFKQFHSPKILSAVPNLICKIAGKQSFSFGSYQL